MSKLHPAIVPILALILVVGVAGASVAIYRSYGQKNAAAPSVWKTREVWKDNKFIQEKYRNSTPQDRERQIGEAIELMERKRRL